MHPGSHVLHCLRFCLNLHKCVMTVFIFYLQSGKRRKVGWVGDDSHVVFGKKFPGEKGSEMVHCHNAIASSLVTKVWGEVLAHFHAVAIKCHSSKQNWLFGLSGRTLCEQSDVKEHDEHTPDFALNPSHLFRFWWVWTFRAQLMLSSPNACLITVSASVALFPRFVQNLVLFLWWSHHEIGSGQMHGSK
jgi:hypothetical protein